MTKQSPEVSVIMACYNAAEYIDEAIGSILNQTLSDFQFIIVDDASTDTTREIIQYYAAKDKRINIHLQSCNAGPAIARNVGIELSTANWIAVLDADDVALQNRLELQLSFVEKNPATVLLGGDCIEIDSKGISFKKHHYPCSHGPLVDRLYKHRAFFPHSSCLYKKEPLVRVGAFNPRYSPSEDYDLWLRLSEIGHIACLSKTLIKLRRHEKSISNDCKGRTQLIHGSAAATCHYIRMMNELDPSMLDEDDWFSFINWMKVRLQQEGFFDRRLFHAELRRSWHSQNSEPFCCKGLVFSKQVLAHPGYCIKIAWERFFGSMLPAQLADEWIQLKGTRKHHPKARKN